MKIKNKETKEALLNKVEKFENLKQPEENFLKSADQAGQAKTEGQKIIQDLQQFFTEN